MIQTIIIHNCPKCGSGKMVQNGHDYKGAQKYHRKDCNSYGTLQAQDGDKLAFIGGLDVRFLETNDRAIIRREVINLVEGMKNRNARFLFATDHSVTLLAHFDSYRYAMDVYREHMMV